MGEQIRLPQVQALVGALALLPMEGRHRVAVVEAAHRLNPDAQNALLKTLEEPPAGTCLILAADDEASLLPTVRSRCARYALAPLALEEVARLLVERGLTDPPRAASLARLAEGRPGLAVALAHEPDAPLIEDRLARTLLDLAAAGTAERLAAVPELLADAAELAERIERGARRAPLDGTEADGPDAGATDAITARAAGGAARAVARPSGRRAAPSPAERRAAVVRLIATWRALARDLAVAAQGGRAHVRHIDLLEELGAVGGRVAAEDVRLFLRRLDELGRAVDAYANPELALDVLLLRWPRAPRVA